MSKRNSNLMFFIQPGESAFTNPERIMKTYLNKFMISEDDQVIHKCQISAYLIFYKPIGRNSLISGLSLKYWA